MNEFTGERAETFGRSIRMRTFGSTPEEIELAALDEARQFFGDDLLLQVVRNYQVKGILPTVDTEAAATGKRYTAEVTVRVVEGAPGE